MKKYVVVNSAKGGEGTIVEGVQLMEPETPQSIAEWCGGVVYGTSTDPEDPWVGDIRIKDYCPAFPLQEAKYGDWIVYDSGVFVIYYDHSFCYVFKPCEY